MYDQHRCYRLIQEQTNHWVLYQLNQKEEVEKELGVFDHEQEATEYVKRYDSLRCDMDFFERLVGYNGPVGDNVNIIEAS